MKLSASEQKSIASLLTRIYQDILAIESEFGLLAGEGDFRPRIEHFHDAIRAFTSGDTDSKRLSVEWLAYDLTCLRYLTSHPLASFKPHGHLSPSTALVATPQTVPGPRRPDRDTKERLGELYQTYAVLFAGLLKPFADRDWRDRVEEINENIERLHKIKDSKARVAARDKEIKAIDQAHMDYVLAQLGIFEAAKDMVKKMAASGMNLVGKFVESSLADAKRDLGR
jgi:hypothetical protein